MKNIVEDYLKLFESADNDAGVVKPKEDGQKSTETKHPQAIVPFNRYSLRSYSPQYLLIAIYSAISKSRGSNDEYAISLRYPEFYEFLKTFLSGGLTYSGVNYKLIENSIAKALTEVRKLGSPLTLEEVTQDIIERFMFAPRWLTDKKVLEDPRELFNPTELPTPIFLGPGLGHLDRILEIRCVNSSYIPIEIYKTKAGTIENVAYNIITALRALGSKELLENTKYAITTKFRLIQYLLEQERRFPHAHNFLQKRNYARESGQIIGVYEKIKDLASKKVNAELKNQHGVEIKEAAKILKDYLSLDINPINELRKVDRQKTSHSTEVGAVQLATYLVNFDIASIYKKLRGAVNADVNKKVNDFFKQVSDVIKKYPKVSEIPVKEKEVLIKTMGYLFLNNDQRDEAASLPIIHPSYAEKDGDVLYRKFSEALNYVGSYQAGALRQSANLADESETTKRPPTFLSEIKKLFNKSYLYSKTEIADINDADPRKSYSEFVSKYNPIEVKFINRKEGTPPDYVENWIENFLRRPNSRSVLELSSYTDIIQAISVMVRKLESIDDFVERGQKSIKDLKTTVDSVNNSTPIILMQRYKLAKPILKDTVRALTNVLGQALAKYNVTEGSKDPNVQNALEEASFSKDPITSSVATFVRKLAKNKTTLYNQYENMYQNILPFASLVYINDPAFAKIKKEIKKAVDKGLINMTAEPGDSARRYMRDRAAEVDKAFFEKIRAAVISKIQELAYREVIEGEKEYDEQGKVKSKKKDKVKHSASFKGIFKDGTSDVLEVDEDSPLVKIFINYLMTSNYDPDPEFGYTKDGRVVIRPKSRPEVDELFNIFNNDFKGFNKDNSIKPTTGIMGKGGYKGLGIQNDKEQSNADVPAIMYTSDPKVYNALVKLGGWNIDELNNRQGLQKFTVSGRIPVSKEKSDEKNESYLGYVKEYLALFEENRDGGIEHGDLPEPKNKNVKATLDTTPVTNPDAVAIADALTEVLSRIEKALNR